MISEHLELSQSSSLTPLGQSGEGEIETPQNYAHSSRSESVLEAERDVSTSATGSPRPEVSAHSSSLSLFSGEVPGMFAASESDSFGDDQSRLRCAMSTKTEGHTENDRGSAVSIGVSSHLGGYGIHSVGAAVAAPLAEMMTPTDDDTLHAARSPHSQQPRPKEYSMDIVYVLVRFTELFGVYFVPYAVRGTVGAGGLVQCESLYGESTGVVVQDLTSHFRGTRWEEADRALQGVPLEGPEKEEMKDVSCPVPLLTERVKSGLEMDACMQRLPRVLRRGVNRDRKRVFYAHKRDEEALVTAQNLLNGMRESRLVLSNVEYQVDFQRITLHILGRHEEFPWPREVFTNLGNMLAVPLRTCIVEFRFSKLCPEELHLTRRLLGIHFTKLLFTLLKQAHGSEDGREARSHHHHSGHHHNARHRIGSTTTNSTPLTSPMSMPLGGAPVLMMPATHTVYSAPPLSPLAPPVAPPAAMMSSGALPYRPPIYALASLPPPPPPPSPPAQPPRHQRQQASPAYVYTAGPLPRQQQVPYIGSPSSGNGVRWASVQQQQPPPPPPPHPKPQQQQQQSTSYYVLAPQQQQQVTGIRQGGAVELVFQPQVASTPSQVYAYQQPDGALVYLQLRSQTPPQAQQATPEYSQTPPYGTWVQPIYTSYPPA